MDPTDAPIAIPQDHNAVTAAYVFTSFAQTVVKVHDMTCELTRAALAALATGGSARHPTTRGVPRAVRSSLHSYSQRTSLADHEFDIVFVFLVAVTTDATVAAAAAPKQQRMGARPEDLQSWWLLSSICSRLTSSVQVLKDADRRSALLHREWAWGPRENAEDVLAAVSRVGWGEDSRLFLRLTTRVRGLFHNIPVRRAGLTRHPAGAPDTWRTAASARDRHLAASDLARGSFLIAVELQIAPLYLDHTTSAAVSAPALSFTHHMRGSNTGDSADTSAAIPAARSSFSQIHGAGMLEYNDEDFYFILQPRGRHCAGDLPLSLVQEALDTFFPQQITSPTLRPPPLREVIVERGRFAVVFLSAGLAQTSSSGGRRRRLGSTAPGPWVVARSPDPGAGGSCHVVTKDHWCYAVVCGDAVDSGGAVPLLVLCDGEYLQQRRSTGGPRVGVKRHLPTDAAATSALERFASAYRAAVAQLSRHPRCDQRGQAPDSPHPADDAWRSISAATEASTSLPLRVPLSLRRQATGSGAAVPPAPPPTHLPAPLKFEYAMREMGALLQVEREARRRGPSPWVLHALSAGGAAPVRCGPRRTPVALSRATRQAVRESLAAATGRVPGDAGPAATAELRILLDAGDAALPPESLAPRALTAPPAAWAPSDAAHPPGCCFPFGALTEKRAGRPPVVFQWDRKFVCVVEGGGAAAVGESPRPPRLWVVDQHAAHERLRLEYFTAVALRLAAPQPCPPEAVPPDVRGRVAAAERALSRWGWRFDSAGSAGRGVFAVVAHPLLRLEGFELRVRGVCALRTMLEELEAAGAHNSETATEAVVIPSVIFDFLVTRSCRGAIFFNDALSASHVSSLLQGMSLTKQFYLCSHGRPCVATSTFQAPPTASPTF